MRNIEYSQNFIKNKKLIKLLIKKTNISNEDTVFDLGAGKGVITDILSEVCKEVVTLEKDNDLFQLLKKRFSDKLNVVVVNQDILKYKFPINRNYKIFSNIPFNATADIIRKIQDGCDFVEDVYLFIQKEAALKYLGNPKENLKSLFIKNTFNISIVHHFKREDFAPKP